MTTSLIERQLPAFIQDCLGTVSFGPKLKSHERGVMNFSGQEMTLEAAMRYSTNDQGVSSVTNDLVNAIQRANPKSMKKMTQHSVVGRWWNALTGADDVRAIEFSLHCRQVRKLVALAQAVLKAAQNSLPVIKALEELFNADIASLEEYIEIGSNFSSELEKRFNTLSQQEQYGLNRLNQRLINLKVSLQATRIDQVKIHLLLDNFLTQIDMLAECVSSVVPVWERLINSAESGIGDVNVDEELNQKFIKLVNKVNYNRISGSTK